MRSGALVPYAAGMQVALCQLPVSSDPSVNLGRVRQALADAARAGAQLAVFPEGTQARFGTDLRAAKDAVANTVEFARGTMGEDAFRESMTPELPAAERIPNPYTYTEFEGSDDRHTAAE